MIRRSFGYAALALLSSAVALYFGTGLHPLWWLTWLAPIPVLVVAPRISQKVAFVMAFLAWAVGGLNLWRYFRVSLSVPLLLALLVVMTPVLALQSVCCSTAGSSESLRGGRRWYFQASGSVTSSSARSFPLTVRLAT